MPYSKAKPSLYCFIDATCLEASHLKGPSLHKARLIHNDLTHAHKVAGILEADTTSENVLKTLKTLSLYMVLFPLLLLAGAVSFPRLSMWSWAPIFGPPSCLDFSPECMLHLGNGNRCDNGNKTPTRHALTQTSQERLPALIS